MRTCEPGSVSTDHADSRMLLSSYMVDLKSQYPSSSPDMPWAAPLTCAQGPSMRAVMLCWKCLRAQAKQSPYCRSSSPTSSTILHTASSSIALVCRPQHRLSDPKLTADAGTMSEIEKALVELKALMKFRAERLGREEEFRALGLTSRKNLCLHPSVRRERSGNVVDARCRSLTAGFVREKKEKGEDVEVCVYHDVRVHRIPIGPCLVLKSRADPEPRTSISSNRTTSYPTASGRWTASCATASSTSSARTLPPGGW
jgi:hypothetical protein